MERTRGETQQEPWNYISTDRQTDFYMYIQLNEKVIINREWC